MGGLVLTPAYTDDLRTKVLFTVLKLPEVQATPGSSPILPIISTLLNVDILYKTTASFPLKSTAVLFVAAAP